MVLKTAAQLIQAAASEAIKATPVAIKSTSSGNMRLPPLPSPRELLKLYKIRAQKNLSQNFLLDYRLNNKIVTKTGNVKNSYVCEVGPGPGNITRSILERGAKHVIVVEKDRRFLPSLELLADACENRLKILPGDIMDLSLENIFPREMAHDWTIAPPPFFIIGNLPFNVSTPLIVKWIRHCTNHTGPFIYGRTRLSLTFQKEVADRMVAESGSHARSRLSIVCQNVFHTEKLFTIPGRAFFPKPDVDVSVVKFTPLIQPVIKHPFALVQKVVTTIFMHRQKNCSYGVNLLFPESKPELAKEVFGYTRINPAKKAFELEIEEFNAICDIYSHLCQANEGLQDYDFQVPNKTKALFPFKATNAKSHEVLDANVT